MAIVLTNGRTLHDVGPQLNSLFALLYSQGTFDESAFQAAAFDYFNTHSNPDPFVFNFGPAALPRPLTTVLGLRLWDFVLRVLNEWEAAHPGQRLHKGGAYYFAGIADIVMGNLTRGFLYIHKAALEDEATYGRGRTPAVAFITLDSRMQDQAFKKRVEAYSRYLQQRLKSYRRFRAGQLTLPQLRACFERHPQLREPLFALAYSVARLHEMEASQIRIVTDTELGRLALSEILLGLALVVEALLLDRYAPLVTGRAPTIVPLAAQYARARGLPVEHTLPTLSTRFRHSFDTTMRTVSHGGTPAGVAPLSPRELDLAVAVGLRNHAAHGLVRSQLVAADFDLLVRRLFYVLFALIENCYP